VTNGRPQSMFVSPSGSSEPPWVVHAQVCIFKIMDWAVVYLFCETEEIWWQC
jgi:hypothetical protein